ncbi:MAG: DUF2279 domain-containing protein [Chitinophagaceae bacterium]|nr:DUF2279 domain-containing protein [Chitinophagaceae bacterium]
MIPASLRLSGSIHPWILKLHQRAVSCKAAVWLLTLLLCTLFIPVYAQNNIDTLSKTAAIPAIVQQADTKIYVSDTTAKTPISISAAAGFVQDSLLPRQKKSRTWAVTGLNVLGYGGVMIALAAAWYDDYPKTKWHSFDDSKEWLQVDKVGHFYSTWIESRANNEMWKWTGMERKKRIWISGLTSFAFQTTIEYLDGRSAKWGWSWADMGTNVLGSGSFIAQELAWDEQKIKLKWSSHRKKYNDPSLNQRSNELFGKSSPERFLKDYNGQTYWASAPLKMILPKTKIPDWLCFSVGYGAEGMFGGTENLARDENGNIVFDRRDIKRYRQWYLAPDIDWSKFKTNSWGLRFLFKILSAFKFPAPALELSNGGLKMRALVF